MTTRSCTYAFHPLNAVSSVTKPSEDDEICLMTAFAAKLNTSTLQTWVAVGSYNFSDVELLTSTI